MLVLQRTQNSALHIATSCTRLTPTAPLYAKSPSPERLSGTYEAQKYSLCATQEHSLHEELHKPVGTQRHIHTTPRSHYTALHAMIPPLPVRKSESSWLLQNFVARAIADVPHNTLLGETPPPVNPDEADLHWQEQVHLAHLQCGHHLALRSYATHLCLEVDPACRWCGEGQEMISHIFQECPQLAVKWATQEICGVRPQWP